MRELLVFVSRVEGAVRVLEQPIYRAFNKQSRQWHEPTPR
jgi:hypothetical protein